MKKIELTPQQARAIALMADAVVDAVKVAGPLGAPGGVLYAGLMSLGLSLGQFEALMSMLVRANVLKREGERYVLTTRIIRETARG